MINKNKLLIKFLNNPDSLHYWKIEKLLVGLGLEKIEAKGSHKKFKHKLLDKDLIIPVHGDCKSFYKNLTAKIIKKYLL